MVESRGLLRVEHGDPSAEELAVLSAVLFAVLAAARSGACGAAADDTGTGRLGFDTKELWTTAAPWCGLRRPSPPRDPDVQRPVEFGR